MFSLLAGRLHKLCLRGDAVQITRQSLRVTPDHLIHYLPALGNVSYLPMHAGAEQVANMPRCFLLVADDGERLTRPASVRPGVRRLSADTRSSVWRLFK
jgi:hypothetical protein